MASTAEQINVIGYRDGHLLVPAVPGSGKTYAMVERVAALLNEGVDPRRLLVLMFNVTAREDFEKRLKKRLSGTSLKMPDVFTFHAFGRRLCIAMEKSNRLPVYKLNEHGWMIQKLAKAAITEANLGLAEEDRIIPDHTNVEQLIEYIEFAKNELAEFSREGLPEITVPYIDAMKQFEAMRKQSKMRTFTDLLYDPTLLVVQDDLVRHWVANRYDELICDEGQDMNQLQITLMSAVAGTRAKVCIVGDEDQSIYEWRGSRPEFMVKLFEQEFPGAQRMPLTNTFRYGHQVALLANHVIMKNHARMDKLCLPGTDTKTKVDISFYKHGQEGQEVTNAVLAWRKEKQPYSGCAVLVREYSHSVVVETSFLEARIPYKIVGAEPFFMRREALALRGCLLLAGNGLDSETDHDRRKAIINAMFSVPATFLRTEVVDALAEQSFPDAVTLIETVRTLISDKSTPSGTKKKLMDRCRAWERVLDRGLTDAAAYIEVLNEELDMQESIFNEAAKAETGLARWRTVQAIQDIAQRNNLTVKGMVDFLDVLKQRYDAMNVSDSVLITSLHRAKGLEWPHVILPGLKDGSFPSFSEEEDIDDDLMESERRLYYVGVTRAKNRLTLVAPEDKTLVQAAAGGKHMPNKNINYYASRFLYESNLQMSLVVGSNLDAGPLTDEIISKINTVDPEASSVVKRYLTALSA